MTKYFHQAVDAIIRPPRHEYDPTTVPVLLEGPDKRLYNRHPMNFINARDQRICGSVYVDSKNNLMDGGPCVVYMHGNASSQWEGQFLVPNLCRRGIAVYCFDFAGCGVSDGDFVSLGHFESMDVEFLLQSLSETFRLGPFVLWGRSMGAATSLLVRHPGVIGCIVDSAFSSIPDLVAAIGAKVHIPTILIPAAVLLLKATVMGRADFDLSKVAPLNSAKQEDTIPMLMCHAVDDDLIPIAQADAIFAAYTNPNKKLIRIQGGHNGTRPLTWISEACIFAMRLLGVDIDDFKAVRIRQLREADPHFKSYEDLLNGMDSKHGLAHGPVSQVMQSAEAMEPATI
jgi:pimeloyl-ACP methyl ester carboxylesterase